jgi:hypothetical protein
MNALPETGVGSALRRLRASSSLAGLFREAAQALCDNLGFERAAIFSLQGRSLALESVHERGAGTASAGSAPCSSRTPSPTSVPSGSCQARAHSSRLRSFATNIRWA